MDKLYEIYTWLLCLAFGCWFVKNEAAPLGDKDSPEVAPAAGPITPEVEAKAIVPTDKIYNDRFHEGTVVAAGLSEMLNRSKVRRNMLRRKEDQHSV